MIFVWAFDVPDSKWVSGLSHQRMRNAIQLLRRKFSRESTRGSAKKRWVEIDHHIAHLLVRSDTDLAAILRASEVAGLPDWSVPPNRAKLLMLLARAIDARRVLEIGTLGGYSTVWLARALAPGGRLISLEVEPTHVEVARANIARAGLSKVVDVRLGRATDLLPTLTADAPFDLVFIDADAGNLAEYFHWAADLGRKGSLIFVDNVIRGGALMDTESSSPTVQGLRRFFDHVAGEARVCTTVIQTVGAGGHDGFALGLVTGDE